MREAIFHRLRSAAFVGILLTTTSAFAQPIPPPACGDERFVLLLFTAQDAVKNPRNTHTWAVMVRMQGREIADGGIISWLPADMRVKPAKIVVERGVNWPLSNTLAWADELRLRTTLWGPYEATAELYSRFHARIAELESGALGYQCFDFLGEAAVRHNGVNCLHAFSAVYGHAPGDVFHAYGDHSGSFFAEVLGNRGLIHGPATDGDAVVAQLGLDATTLVRRDLLPAYWAMRHRLAPAIY